MLSKLVANKNQNLLNLSTRAFRASAVANKKPSIGDAVTILQSKVSGINQVVSITLFINCRVRSNLLALNEPAGL